MYALQSENLTHLGGPMGSEYTTTNYIKYFTTINKAKAYAENEYSKRSKSKKKIAWEKDSYGGITSGDLLYVMYTINKIVPTE